MVGYRCRVVFFLSLALRQKHNILARYRDRPVVTQGLDQVVFHRLAVALVDTCDETLLVTLFFGRIHPQNLLVGLANLAVSLCGLL